MAFKCLVYIIGSQDKCHKQDWQVSTWSQGDSLAVGPEEWMLCKKSEERHDMQKLWQASGEVAIGGHPCTRENKLWGESVGITCRKETGYPRESGLSPICCHFCLWCFLWGPGTHCELCCLPFYLPAFPFLCFTDTLVVYSTGPVTMSGHHPLHPPRSAPSKFDLSPLTPEVIKLASDYTKSALLNGSSLWARKWRTVFLVEVFQPIQRKIPHEVKIVSSWPSEGFPF